MPKMKFFRKKKKVIMPNQDDLEASKDEYERITCVHGIVGQLKASDSRPDSDPNEVFSNLTRSEVEPYPTEILEKFQSLQNTHKDLKRIHVADSEALSELKKKNHILKEKKMFLKNITLL